uniref:Uncharacterized protein n=1 Tax=Knipowitschia caucasica TaxID=637954 RepID=A0AAV2K6Q4_KNICA
MNGRRMAVPTNLATFIEGDNWDESEMKRRKSTTQQFGVIGINLRPNEEADGEGVSEGETGETSMPAPSSAANSPHAAAHEDRIHQREAEKDLSEHRPAAVFTSVHSDISSVFRLAAPSIRLKDAPVAGVCTEVFGDDRP